MENKKKVYDDQIEPLLKQAFEIAVANKMPLVWSIAYAKEGENFLLATSANVDGDRGKDFPPIYLYMYAMLGLPSKEKTHDTNQS
jgi:hypothetical protein